MAPYWFGSRLTAQPTESSYMREAKLVTETHSLQKTREKIQIALDRDPSGKVTVSNKTARSIIEHLWRLAELDK